LEAGRFFSKQFFTDSLSLILNEEAVKQLGLKDPLGARLTSPDQLLTTPDGKSIVYTVVGVVKDFHFQSLHDKISPLIFINSSKFGGVNSLMAIHINSSEMNSAIDGIEKTWHQFVPQSPLDYTFLDKNLLALYSSEETTRQVFSFFSALAIFIACLGLLGLVTYAVQLRVREIGIRKVLGAKVSDIVLLLSRDFLELILIASIIAFPIAWLGMNKWLQDYAYRIEMSWWIFALAGMTALFIAVATISFKAIKAAIANPVQSLRTE
jgi:putative ABC transport system permease protein